MNNEYISPKQQWHRFCSDSEKMEFLKDKELLPKTFEEIKKFYYNGVFVKCYTPCEVLGYMDNTVIVIEIDNQLHCIDLNYFKDMQPTEKQKEKYKLL